MNILKTIRRHKPTSVEEFEDELGLDLIAMDNGSFREVYNISGTRLVVKIPMEIDLDGCGVHAMAAAHSRREIRRIRQVLRRKNLTHIRRYVPKVYYADYKSGVIVMEMLRDIGKVDRAAENIIAHMLEDTFPCVNNCSDAKSTNLGINTRGQIKVLDWGCV